MTFINVRIVLFDLNGFNWTNCDHRHYHHTFYSNWRLTVCSVPPKYNCVTIWKKKFMTLIYTRSTTIQFISTWLTSKDLKSIRLFAPRMYQHCLYLSFKSFCSYNICTDAGSCSESQIDFKSLKGTFGYKKWVFPTKFQI